MQALRQIAAVTGLNLRALSQRRGASLVIVTGMACVVAVTLSMMSLSAGLRGQIMGELEPTNIILTSQGAEFTAASILARDIAETILDAPQIRRDADGKAIAIKETFGSVQAIKRSDGIYAFVQIHGVDGDYFGFRPALHIVEGRKFTSGLHEMIVNRKVVTAYEGFEPGAEVVLQDGPWKVVGIFEGPDQIIVDGSTLLTSYRRNAWSIVTAAIGPGEGELQALKDGLSGNPLLKVNAERETDYNERAMSGFNAFLLGIVTVVAGIMALGAIFGALNTMYAAVAGRTQEIATLRAIGFGSMPVLVSVLAEAMLLACTGALIGACVAWLIFNGRTKVMAGFTFDLLVTPQMFLFGVVMALAIGLLGALLPALRAARLPITNALQVR